MSGIPPNVWAAQDWRTIATAADLLTGKKDDDEGRQMGG